MSADSLNNPLVTAIIPVYNHQEYVLESIRSIIRQTYADIELIVLNDGSRDGSHDIVMRVVPECRERFVRFEYRNRGNVGLSGTLNEALKWAQGEYISALASDDVALPEKIARLVAALESEECENCAAAFGDASFIDRRSNPVKVDVQGVIQPEREYHVFDSVLDTLTARLDLNRLSEDFGSYRSLLFSNYLPAMCNLLRTKCVRDVGGWTRGNILEDWEMWLKLSKLHKFRFVDQTLALYRVHGCNTFDTMREEMLYARVNLIANEHDYCMRKGLASDWKMSMNHQLYQFVRDGRFTHRRKLEELKHWGVLSFLSYLCYGGAKTVRRVLSGNP